MDLLNLLLGFLAIVGAAVVAAFIYAGIVVIFGLIKIEKFNDDNSDLL